MEYKRVVFFNKLQESAEIIVGKNRNGETGSIDVLFHKQHSRFADKPFGAAHTAEFQG